MVDGFGGGGDAIEVDGFSGGGDAIEVDGFHGGGDAIKRYARWRRLGFH